MGLIQKLGTAQYLKKIGSMNAMEKESYMTRVRAWRESGRELLMIRKEDRVSAFQNVMACAGAWSDAEVKAWNEGIVLVTALTSMSDGNWLPDAVYVKSAKRAIAWITAQLDKIDKQYSGVWLSRDPSPEKRAAYFGEGAVDTSKVGGTVAKVKEKQAGGFVAAMEEGKTGDAKTRELWAMRPKHVDQYVHLLSKKAQNKASHLKQLLMDLDMARENARKLSEDPHHNASDVAYWAKIATSKDDSIREIYALLDEEWAALVKAGNVVVDDLGVARVRLTPDPSLSRRGEEGDGNGRLTPDPSLSKRGEEGDGNGRLTPDPSLSKRGDENGNENDNGNDNGDENGNENDSGSENGNEKGDGNGNGSGNGNENGCEEEEKAARVAQLRKWLIDTRKAKKPSHDEKWISYYKEMVSLGGDDAVTERVVAAAERYGIDLNAID